MADEDKKILITGINNKYQIKKLKKEPLLIKKKKSIENYNFPDKYFQENQQMNILLYIINLKNSSKINEEEELNEEYCKIIFSMIEKKITSYKQQDVIKNRYESDKLIKSEDVLRILKENDLQCHYCKEKVYLLYEVVRESRQWTLDRINNDLGHNTNNCLLSCLECNLKRRKTKLESFLFTKQLNIVKI
jgi:5-methylcytosine-specific restriction endonuclease McrA